MQAIVLAAGMGKRFGEYTHENTKCMLMVNGVRLIDRTLESFHSLFRFGSKVLVATIISSVYTNLYNLAIGKKFNSADLGFYTRADQFTSLVSKNVTDIINRVSLPVLTNIQDDDIRLVDAYRKYIKAATFLIFPLTMGLCGIAKR